MLRVARNIECECDGYHGYVCSKHRRIALIEDALCERLGRAALMDDKRDA